MRNTEQQLNTLNFDDLVFLTFDEIVLRNHSSDKNVALVKTLVDNHYTSVEKLAKGGGPCQTRLCVTRISVQHGFGLVQFFFDVQKVLT